MTESRQQTPVEGHHGSHDGNTVAAWVAVTLIMFGGLVVALGVTLLSWVVSIAGAVVIVVGAISAKVLAAMGFGASGKPAR